jgi:hypothetical protein
LSPRPAKTGRPILTIYKSNDAVSRKAVPLGIPTLPKTSKGFISPKPPKFEPGIGISSLNKTMNKFSTAHAIFAQISSISAAWRNKFSFQRNDQNFVQGITFWEKRPQWGFQAKTRY